MKEFVGVSEILANIDTINNSQGNSTRKPRRMVNRMFRITPYRIRVVRGRTYTKKFESVEVSANLRKRTVAEFKRNGFARVDVIEIETTVNETIGTVVIEGEGKAKYRVNSMTKEQFRKLEFAQQIFAAARDKAKPKAIEVLPVSAAQVTIPCRHPHSAAIEPNAYLSDKPVVKVKDRQNAIKAENKRYALFNKLNKQLNEADRMAIFDRKSGGFLFASIYQEEIVDFIQVNELALEDIILYVPNDVYWMLREME